MTQDKYSAVWVSHSSISNFLQCPRAYYLNNVYKDPATGHKITLMTPPLALGQAVHEVIESLSTLPVEQRFGELLMDRFDRAWSRVGGRKGGFSSVEGEQAYKKRGREMIERVVKNPGPLANLAVKIRQDLPHYWLSEADNIILCGRIDWLEYLPDTEAVHIIDFKTGRGEQDGDSLQLPIYLLLAQNTQKHPVVKASYWYLDRHRQPMQQQLPDADAAYQQVLAIAKKIKTARQLGVFKCPHTAGCRACRPLEQIVRGEAIFVGVNDFGQDMYVANNPAVAAEVESIIH